MRTNGRLSVIDLQGGRKAEIDLPRHLGEQGRSTVATLRRPPDAN